MTSKTSPVIGNTTNPQNINKSLNNTAFPSSGPGYNNNNYSEKATSIITAPLMSQAQNSSMQKQTATNVSSPSAAAAAKSGITGGIGGVGGSVNISGAAASAASSTPNKTTGISGISNPGGISATDPKKTGVTTSNFSSPLKNPEVKSVPVSSSSSAGSTGGTITSSPAPKPVSPSKPLDFNKPIMMNGGATAVMKQPPIPVNVLPPTPVATPPSIHKQPPSLPPQSQQSSNNINQKSQCGEAPAPSNNNPPTQPLKQSSGGIEKKEDKPTQPLPVQPPKNQSVTTTIGGAPNNKEGIQDLKAGPALITTDQQQKAINKVPSSVADNLNTSNTASNKPIIPASSVGNSGIKSGQSVVTQPTSSSVQSNTSQVLKNSVPSTGSQGIKKMESSEGDKVNVMMEGSKLGGGDAPAPIIPPIIGGKNNGGSADLNEGNNNQKNLAMISGNNTPLLVDSSSAPGGGKKEAGEVKKEDGILSKTNDINKSIYVPSSGNEDAIIGKSEKPVGSFQQRNSIPKKEGVIGEDVQRIMEAIESAGLCAPKNASDGDGISTKTASKVNRSSSLSKPNTATGNGTTRRSMSRPGTAASPQVKALTSPTKGRPATASSAGKKENGASGIPLYKSPKEKVAPASGTSNGSSLPPKSGTNPIRTSTSRVSSSAKNNSTSATTPANKTPTENKKAKASGAGGDGNSAVETDTGAGTNASQSRSTPRVRPSSSLYRPTASSALKGVSSAPHNSVSNHNLSSSPSTPRTSRSSTGARASRSDTSTMGDSAGGSGEGKATLKDQFVAFARFGNKEEDGKHITLSNCDKWMKQAKVIDAKKITTTDTSICFKKLFKTAKKITFEDFKKYVEELAKSKKIEPQELLDKLANCGAPGLSSATRAAHSNVVDRLTDTSKYTGSHKERFDSTGKGRGIEGRKDVPDSSGYVAAFKEKLDLKDGEGGKEEKRTSASPTPAN